MTAARLLERLQSEEGRALVHDFLLRQRWFGGRGHHLGVVTVVDAVLLRDDEPAIVTLLVDVRYEDGTEETYHLPLTGRPLERAAVREPEDHRLVSVGEEDGAAVAIYDALADADCVAALWAAMHAGETHTGVRGSVRCTDLGLRSSGVVDVRPLGREQSNSSVVRGEGELLKCVRRISDGTSPEVEMTQALAAAGFAAVPAPLGTIEYLRPGTEPVLLAIAQPYLHNGTEGWQLALTSLRDLYAIAEEDTVADQEGRSRLVAEQGATFVPEAARIGELTAAMHLTMLSAALPPRLRATPVVAADLDAWAVGMTAELDALLDRDEAALQPLRRHRDALAAVFDALRELPEGGNAIRIHGDYHLGQLLRTDSGWTVTDFEGEPLRSPTERRRRSSPLRDVAGMLRSFDYAAAVALAERCPPSDPNFPALQAQGDAWSRVNRSTFWKAYREHIRGTGLLPEGEAPATLCRALELRKAVYEVGYELGHRPDWVDIPLRFLLAAVSA